MNALTLLWCYLSAGSEGERDGEQGANHHPTAALLRDMAYKSSLRWRHTYRDVSASSGQRSILVATPQLLALGISRRGDQNLLPCMTTGRKSQVVLLLPPSPFLSPPPATHYDWQRPTTGNYTLNIASGSDKKATTAAKLLREREWHREGGREKERRYWGIPTRARDKIGAAVSGQNS